MANVRRFLTGIGAPGGPARIGSSQSPAANDPGVTEQSQPRNIGGSDASGRAGPGTRSTAGWTWALGDLDGVVPNAREYAFDELTRNTLAAHATAYPNHWDGVISVDDACRSWYSTDPANCGVGLSTGYDTQIMHQPAWSLFDAIKLAGVTPTAAGYRIVPHLPMQTFNIRFPQVGVAQQPGTIRGYLRAVTTNVTMQVPAEPGSGAPHGRPSRERIPGRQPVSRRRSGPVPDADLE